MTTTEEILVLSATAFEQLALREAVAERVQRNVAEREWVSGKIGTQPVTLVATGIGAVNTAHALTCYLQGQRPRRVVQVGVGGAYPESGASVGDLALASEEYYGDLGVRTPDGWQGGELIGIPVLEKGRSYYNAFPSTSSGYNGRQRFCRKLTSAPSSLCRNARGTDELGVERGRRFGGFVRKHGGRGCRARMRLVRSPFCRAARYEQHRRAARAGAMGFAAKPPLGRRLAVQKLIEEGLCA